MCGLFNSVDSKAHLDLMWLVLFVHRPQVIGYLLGCNICSNYIELSITYFLVSCSKHKYIIYSIPAVSPLYYNWKKDICLPFLPLSTYPGMHMKSRSSYISRQYSYIIYFAYTLCLSTLLLHLFLSFIIGSYSWASVGPSLVSHM